MLTRKVVLSAVAAMWLAVPAFADGGPVPEPAPPPAPPPEPAPEYEPAPEPEPAPPPAAESQYYIEGFGGVSFAGDLNYGCCEFEMETGWNAGGAIGAHLNNHWDMELDIFYARLGYGGCATLCDETDFDSHLSGFSIMLDLIYNFDTGSIVDPYLGAGFGVTEVSYDSGDDFAGFSGSDWLFGYQFMGGLMFHVGSNVDLFAEYRFHDVAGDAEIEGVTDIEYRTHNVSGGIRLNF